MSPSPRRLAARLAAVAATGLALAVLAAPGASAHIRVSSPDAAVGGYADLVFRVPTEKDTASTTAVKVTIPADRPLASVSVQPHPGWTATMQRTTLAQPLQTDDGPVTEVVSSVVWTADTPQAGIAPGQFDQFSLLAGPLPAGAPMTFPADQTYSDGSVVSWNESAAPGAPEPEHPSPTLTLAADSAPAPEASGSSVAPLVLSIVALVVAVAAVGVALRGARR